MQNVYSSSSLFKIHWLNIVTPPNVYTLDFLDQTELDCVLTHVKMERVAKETYSLPPSQEARISTILDRSIKVERGELLEEETEEEEGK